jgi:crotonobetainyl-CoA:carnitine CoA-transferase CaiB-like acyl-CoA transferase
MQLNMPWQGLPKGAGTGNPLVANYRTKDERFLGINCLQAARYWAEFCQLIDRPEAATDARFADADGLRENAGAAADIVRAALAERTLDEWRERLEPFSGQWAVVQNTLEAAVDPQTEANGYVQECHTSDGTPFKLIAAPIQYDGVPAQPQRSPEFNEHGDAILGDLGIDWDTIVDLKVRGVVA